MSKGKPSGQAGYLHRCLTLFPQVTEIRYDKRQRLVEVEREVADRLTARTDLWEVVHTIYNSPNFDAGVFGPLHGKQIEADLKRQVDGEWRSLPDERLIKGEHSVLPWRRKAWRSHQAFQALDNA